MKITNVCGVCVCLPAGLPAWGGGGVVVHVCSPEACIQLDGGLWGHVFVGVWSQDSRSIKLKGLTWYTTLQERQGAQPAPQPARGAKHPGLRRSPGSLAMACVDCGLCSVRGARRRCDGIQKWQTTAEKGLPLPARDR